MPAISVLMPVYNGEAFLKEAVDSVLQQDFENFELIVINDGSTDGTARILSAYTDERIRVIHAPKQGIAAALNLGLSEARAELIARFDADDICEADRLSFQWRFMQQHPEVVAMSGAAEYIDESGQALFEHQPQWLDDASIKSGLLQSCPFIHAASCFRKPAVLAVGGYPLHAHSFEDHLLWIRLVRQGAYYNVRKKLIRVRLNPGSITIDERWRNAEFHRLKRKALLTGFIGEDEGEALLGILRSQDNQAYKKASYHALVAKKLLWNNTRPAEARKHLGLSIRYQPRHLFNYLLYGSSFLPAPLIQTLYRKLKSAGKNLQNA